MAVAKKVPSAPKKRAKAVDSVVQDGTPVLRAHAKALSQAEILSPKTQALIARMKAVLAREKFGVGLAAPQIGEGVRIFIIAGRVFASKEKAADTTETPAAKLPAPQDRVFINPVIVRTSKTVADMSEGCLSVRGLYGSVPRHEKATVRAHDENGKSFTLNGTGLLAQIFQHEVDHLDGILYVDKATHLEPDAEATTAKTKRRVAAKK